MSSLSSFTLPPGYARIKVVHSFNELAATPFADGVNALCWKRTLDGDFNAVVSELGPIEEIDSLDADRLRGLRLTVAGRTAVDFMLADRDRLGALGLSPVLDCIRNYPRDEDPTPVPTDVYSFHADSATGPADTWLCSYAGAASEGLRNDEAVRHIDLAATRAELLARFGGPDDASFREYLKEYAYDLHYAPMAHARPFSFGLGNLWRIAVDYPGSPVPPCIHRAPETQPDAPPRLLLIS